MTKRYQRHDDCTECGDHGRIAARGLCYTCYMRQRRRAAKPNAGRRNNGDTLRVVMSWGDTTWVDDFHARVHRETDPDACWPWMGSLNKGGYGMLWVGGFGLLAHRVAHATATGETECEVVMHTCDNPTCCNPSHLRGGTYKENMADMHEKGRHPNSK